MVSDNDLTSGIAVLIREHTELHWRDEIDPHADRIAAALLQRIRSGEREEVPLISYLVKELSDLNAYSAGKAEEIVKEVMKLVRDQDRRGAVS
jgi:hypothetical protein